ncbi:negative regulator of flagellin synthesis FlgM [Rheinheimera pacifica]|uniref:flagellar biosynthesis anti-sigma factor FlgM n=1 Tax=Rheinheimera pacifica TaxID=173990 RepID=UPI0028645E3C|nr:flagellar biosynthesis anti-sigma factor FlgM [Rheinheimera pacifica]MDR6984257.1 negative regulator of flagellin synthesis FlgM [Rheinheimera pacifica]
MQIDPKNPLQVNPVNRLTQEQHSAEPAKTPVAGKTEAGVSQVSAFSRSLEQTFQGLADKDSVDMAKVQQLKQAIANGELQLDEDALVSAMLEMHKR